MKNPVSPIFLFTVLLLVTVVGNAQIAISSYSINGGGTVVSNGGITANCVIGEALAASKISSNGITAFVGIGPSLAPAPFLTIQKTTTP